MQKIFYKSQKLGLASVLCLSILFSMNSAMAFQLPSWFPGVKKNTLNGPKQIETNLGPIDLMGTAENAEKVRENIERRKATSLTPIQVSPDFNAMLFQSGGFAIKNEYLLMPNLVIFGSTNEKLKSNIFGQVTIPIKIAIIDGLSKYLLDQNNNLIEIPDHLLIHNVDGLKQELIKNYNIEEKDFSLGAAPGCPRSIRLSTPEGQFDLTPNKSNEADYCRINRPFTVNLTVSSDKAQRILGQHLREGYNDVFVDYETMAAVPVSMLTAKLKRSRFYDLLKTNAALSKPPLLRVTVEQEIEKLIKNGGLSVYIQGDYNNQMRAIVDQLITRFFTPFETAQSEGKNQGSDQNNRCKDTDACLVFKQTSKQELDEININWSQSSNVLMNKVLQFHNTLGEGGHKVVTVGYAPNKGASNNKHFSNRNYTSKQGQNFVTNWDLTGFQPLEGDIVDIILSSLQSERRLGPEYLSRTVKDRQCTGRESWPPFGCTWTEYLHEYYSTDYSESIKGELSWTTFNNPFQNFPNHLHEMDVYFVFDVNGKEETVSCEILHLRNPESLPFYRLIIANNEYCEVFNKDRKVIKRMGLHNRIKDDENRYTTGERHKSPYHPTTDTYDENTKYFDPLISLVIDATLRGKMFMTN